MRAAAALLLSAVACATTVRDLPADRPPAGDAALLAGRLDFDGSPIEPRLLLEGERGDFVFRPQGPDFLVALPPGPYAIRRFGGYAPKAGDLTVHAVPGEATYIGSFRAVRDGEGELRVAVRDELPAVMDGLAGRYGLHLPPLRGGLVRSSLEPLVPGGTELVIAVEPLPRHGPSYGFSFGFVYCTPYHHHHHHGRCR